MWHSDFSIDHSTNDNLNRMAQHTLGATTGYADPNLNGMVVCSVSRGKSNLSSDYSSMEVSTFPATPFTRGASARRDFLPVLGPRLSFELPEARCCSRLRFRRGRALKLGPGLATLAPLPLLIGMGGQVANVTPEALNN